MVINPTRLGEEILLRAIDAWLEESRIGDEYVKRSYRWKILGNGSIRDSVKTKFNDWLWKQGAYLKKEHGKCYLEFLEHNNAVMFALKWS